MLMFGFVIMGLAFLALTMPYVWFPLLCRMMKRRGGHSLYDEQATALPMVSVLIPAYNEESYIESKVHNVLSLSYPEDRIQIVVCDDGSTDRTSKRLNRLARKYNVDVIRHEKNQGKAVAINALMRAASGDIAIVTDVSASLDRASVRVLVDALDDPQVGMAQVRYFARSTDHGRWKLAATLRSLMSQSDMLIGMHGACFACRPSLVQALPADTINDDYVLPLLAREAGYRVIHVEGGGAYECARDRQVDHVARWRRIARGNAQMLWRYRRLANPTRGRLAASFVLHKGFKTLGPVWMLAFVVGCALAAMSSLYAFKVALAMVLLGLVLLLASPRLFEPVKFGLSAQVAVMGGLFDAIRGHKTQWRAEPMRFDRPAPVPRHIQMCKRIFDVSCALVGLTAGAPVMALVALLIKLDDGGPVFYKQERVCRVHDGREETFEMMKFRTMRVDAESASGPAWATDNDTRVTSIGQWLRRFRLDELPQLWHVLTGEMSLVGPRPERPHFTAQLQRSIAFYDDRMVSMKPGITGLAQIHCGYDTSIDSVREKIRYDLLYNAHLYRLPQYLRMELSITIKTIGVAFSGRGAK